MAALLTEAEIRAHLRLDDDVTAEVYAKDVKPSFDDAEADIADSVGIDLTTFTGNILKLAKRAVLMRGHQWYSNRSDDTKSDGLQSLIVKLQAAALPSVEG